MFALNLSSVSAQIYYDVNGATAGFGDFNSTTWNATNTNWTTNAAGNVATIAWDNNSGTTTFDTQETGTTLTVSVADSFTLSGLAKIGANRRVDLVGSGAQTLTLQSAGAVNVSAGQLVLSTNMSLTAAGGGFEKTGAGVLTFAGAGTVTGNVTISGGIVSVAAKMGSSNRVILNGGSLQVNTDNLSIGSLSSTSTGNVTWSNSANTRTLTIHQTVDGTLQGNLTGIASGGGTSSYVKEGNAQLTLQGTNSFNGSMAVNNGTLMLTGSIASGGGITVAAGAVMRGTGSITGAGTSASISGSLRPGTTGIGSLTIERNVIWNSNDAWVFELGTAGADMANFGASDLLNLTGIGSDFLKGTGSTWTFDFAGTGAIGWYKLVDWTGTTDFLGTNFSATGLASGLSGSFTVDTTTSALYLSVIPEPSSMALLGGLGILMLIRRWTRRSIFNG